MNKENEKKVIQIMLEDDELTDYEVYIAHCKRTKGQKAQFVSKELFLKSLRQELKDLKNKP